MNKFMLKGYKKVKDPEVKKKLMPNYESGCKRVTPHASYATVMKEALENFGAETPLSISSLKTFNKPHVKLVTDKIDCITESGIKTVKEEHKLDAIIYATGFDLIKSLNAYKIVGLGGRDLGEEMGDSPAALNGVVVVSTMESLELSTDLTQCYLISAKLSQLFLPARAQHGTRTQHCGLVSPVMRT